MSGFRTRWRGAVLAGAATAIALALPLQAQEFKLTPAKEMAANPHRFWARGVVFRDTLLSTPSANSTKIADRAAFPFTTKILGTCHADEEIAPVIRGLETGREYIFTATVFGEKRGWIRRKTVYRYLVTGVDAPIADVANLPEQTARALAERGDDDPYAKRLLNLKTLTTRVQEFLSVIAAAEGIEREELFDPSSEHFEKLILAARRAVNDLEVESGIPGREHLAQIIVALVALAESRLQPPAVEEPPATTPAPAPVKDSEEPLVPVESEPAAEPETSPLPAGEAPSTADDKAPAPAIEQPKAPPAPQRQDSVPRSRERARTIKDAKPLPPPSLRLNVPLAAPALDNAPVEPEPAASSGAPSPQVDSDAPPAEELQPTDPATPMEETTAAEPNEAP